MPDTSTVLLIVILGLVSFTAYQISGKEQYGLFHLELNREPGEDSKSTPKTEWMNQGYWKDTDSFPQACRALAHKLCQAVNLKAGESILDVGHGTGESLVMFLTDPALPRPSKLTGVTSLSFQCNRAKERISHIQSSDDTAGKVQVDIFCGDAICRDKTAPNHPLHILNPAKFDVIFALDCAFHFNTRRQFLSQAFQKQSPGGRIVLGDLCLESPGGSPTATIIFLTTKIMGLMPRENMISSKQYVTELEELGYTDVIFEDITQDVFQGIFKFLVNKGWIWFVYASLAGIYRKKAGLRFIVVSARKPLRIT